MEPTKNKISATIGSISETTSERIGLGILFLFAIILLGGYNYEYLYKVQNSNLFLANSIFFGETMEHSAGLLRYAGRYLTQYLYHPWLGAFFMALGIVAIKQLTDRLTGGRGKLPALNFLPALLCLLTQTVVGYTIYCNFESAFIVELEIGLLISLALANLLKTKLSLVWMTEAVIVCGLLFFAIGIYANLALLIAALIWFKTSKTAGIAGIASALASQGVLSFISGSFILNEDPLYTFFSPLPDSVYSNLFTLSLITIVSIIALPLVNRQEEGAKQPMAINALIFALSLAGVVFFTNRDTNFRTELKLQHLTEEHKWDEIISTANELERPTNIADSYRFLALHQTNRLWSEGFKNSGRLDTIRSPYKGITDLAFTPDLYFYCSLVNKAYRWEMEKWVTTGRTVELLKQFVIYALVRDEQPLAKRYTNLLKQTSCYKGWATDMEKYIGHRDQLFADYPSYKRVFDGQVNENIYTDNCNLQTSYAKYRRPEPEQMRLRLMTDLYYLNMEQFVADFRYACSAYQQQMPVYMQEALTIYAMQSKQHQVLQMFPVSREVIQYCNNFFQELRLYQGHPEEGAKQMEKYKGSLCYHMAFCNIYDYQNLNK
ncbi:MAG: DUF6057 family protein [Paludibacteraceae bacterium]|nr:DUF6057 family protein [Paludibacteraceae bacterium]